MTLIDIPDGIAVIGMDCRLPGAMNVEQFWSNLKNGVESIKIFSDDDLIESGIDPSVFNHPDYVRKGFTIDDEDRFDASFFDYSPREAEIMDPQHRLFLESAWKTLEDGGYSPYEYKGSIGVFAGTKLSTYLMNLLNGNPLGGDISGFQTLLGNDKDYLTTRVSYKLNLKGPSVVVQSACSTSLVAVHLACENLLSGACDMALAGGAAVIVPQKTGYMYQEGMVLSADGRCRAFDANAQGMAPGNGVGMVLLKRLEDALEDRDHIYAVIRGSAVNNDGAHKVGYTTPSVDGQAQVIKEAISISGIGAESISYVETHGTGTKLGDPVEIEALNKVFRSETEKKNFCAIGSVKPNIGHLDTVAGVASLIKTVLSLKNGQIPPSINYDQPNPKIDFQNSPFFVNSRLSEWQKNGTPRRAGVSAFGFGGTNAHVVLEEAPDRSLAAGEFKWPLHIMTLSAKSKQTLMKHTRGFKAFLGKDQDHSIQDICFTANAGRTHFQYRLAVLGKSKEEMAARLERMAENLEKLDNGTYDAQEVNSGQIVFMFTGQGAQYAGMGRGLYESQAVFRKTMDRCDRILKPLLGCSILSVIFGNEENRQQQQIDETAYTQPALFVLEYSLAEMWRSWGVKPSIVLGHSAGEYVAACVAGIFSLEDALTLIAARGRLMQEVSGKGAMFAVFASEDEVSKIIEPYSDDVSIAAVNGPEHVVVSGLKTSLGEIHDILQAKGIETHQLTVSHAFHSPMMSRMLSEYEREMENIRFSAPKIKLVSNLTGEMADSATICHSAYWCRHVMEPVRFASSVALLHQNGYGQFLEIGPKPVLLAMARQSLPGNYGSWYPTLKQRDCDWQNILDTLGALYMSGLSIDWNGFYRDCVCHRASLPVYPFERNRYWIKKSPKKIRTLPDVHAKKDSELPEECFLEVVWREKDHLGDNMPLSREPGTWLVFADRGGLGERIADLLRMQGNPCFLVYAGNDNNDLPEGVPDFDASRPESYGNLLDFIKNSDSPPIKGIMHLWSLDSRYPEVIANEVVNSSHFLVCESTLNLVKAINDGQWDAVPRFCLVTQGVQPVGGRNDPISVRQSPLWGIGKVISIEHPELNCIRVDMDSSGNKEDVNFLFKELYADEPESEVAFRNGVRYAPRIVPLSTELGVDKNSQPIRDNSTYMITGGLGALGMETARWLVAQGAKHIVLLGRKRPPEKVESILSSLQRGGADIAVLSCDVTKREQLSSIIEAIRADMPPLKGVFHAAGILEPGASISKENHDTFLRVTAPKIEGAWNLHELTKDIPLDFFVCFSSVVSLWGSHGMVSYTAANIFLDALTHFRRRNGLKATSINWGPWSKIGVVAEHNLSERLSMQGLGTLSPERGIMALNRIIHNDIAQIGVVSADWPKIVSQFHNKTETRLFSELEDIKRSLHAETYQEAEIEISLERLYGGQPSEREAALKKYLKAKIARLLHLEEEQIDKGVDLIRLGLDSLMFLELARIIETDLNTKVAPKEFLETPCVEALGSIILSKIPASMSHEVKTGDDAGSFSVIPAPENRHVPFELTDIQHAYWIGRSGVADLGDVGCHVYFEIETEDLDIDRYTAAWKCAIDRHEMLRAVIRPDGRQQILENIPLFQIKTIDMKKDSSEASERKISSIRKEMSHHVMAADQWPLFEICAVQTSEKQTVLHIGMDMLIVDGYSIYLLFREIFDLYHNPDLKMPAIGCSFRDYVLAEKEFRKSDLYLRSKEYWLERLPALPPSPELPLAKNPSELVTTEFIRRDTRIESEIWGKLKKRASEAGLTSSNILLAAYAEVISLWSKSQHFTLNLTFFNRLHVHPQVNDIIGDFTSLTLLEVASDRRVSFKERAQRIQKQLWSDIEYRYLGGVRILREIAKSNGRESGALMPVVFTSNLGYENINQDSRQLMLPGKIVYNISQTPQVWLDNQISEMNGDLLICWDAVEDLFPAGLLDDMFHAYCRFLRELADQDALWEGNNPQLIPEGQLNRRRTLDEDAVSQSPEMLHTMFGKQVLKNPEQIAVLSSGRSLSYGELSIRAITLARVLTERGVSANVLVAVVMEKGWEQIVAVLGILYSGAAYLPIDPSVPGKRLRDLLNDGEVEIALTQSWLEKELEWPGRVMCFSVDKQTLPEKDPGGAEQIQTADDLAYVIYTSGSTGVPKGVMIDHRGAVNTIKDINSRFNITSADKVFALSNLNFDLSVFDIFGTLAAGGSIVMPDSSGVKDPGHWLKVMEKEEVTIWNSVPTLMQMLVESVSGKVFPGIKNLRLVLLSGDWIPLELPGKITAIADNARVISLGGATEASVWSILYPVEKVDPQWKRVPYGRSMANQKFYVLNANMDECPDWVTGQLYISGIGLAKGYWRDKEKTDRRFFNHPGTGIRLYRTGDLGRYLPDGTIDFLGREDYQVKINGHRIELGEIEAVIRQYPGVKDAVVVVVDDTERNKFLAGYVVPIKGHDIPVDELDSFLRNRLAGYMVPSSLMVIETFPLTLSGKLDRKQLPAPDKSDQLIGVPYVAPENALEEKIARIVQDVLGIEKASTHDRFFNMGANSLDIVKIQNLLTESLPHDVSVTDLFEYSTIRDLAQYMSLDKEKKDSGSKIRKKVSARKAAAMRKKNRRPVAERA